MSELTKTNQVQTTINPGPIDPIVPSPMVKVEVQPFQGEGDPDSHDPSDPGATTTTNATEIAVVVAVEAEIETQEVQVEVPISTASSEETLINQIITSEPLNQNQDEPVKVKAATTKSVSSVAPASVTGTGMSVVAVANQVMAQQHQHQQIVQIQAPSKCQDVRVDNWGNYCLQRLQVMYDRGDFCDLTMQFQTNQLLKVHRVVVNLCTEYFANLERLFGLTDGVLVLPKDIEYQAMVTIVKFFYTGKLEIRGNQFNEVYKTVKLMNITILIKLLEAHAKKPVAQTKKEPTRPIVFKQAVEIGRPQQKGQTQSGQITGAAMKSVSFQGAGGKTLQVTTPGAKLPPGVKTKTVLARVQSQSVRSNQQNIHKAAAQKKLPIWKERKFGPGMATESQIANKWPIKDEPARPTRFEWGDPEEDLTFSNMSSTVISHTLMDKQKLSSSSSSRKVEDIFDAVKSQNLGKRNFANANSLEKDQPATKMIKINPSAQRQDEMITADHDQVNLTEETVEEVVSTSEPVPATKKGISILKSAIKTSPHSFRPTQMVGKNDPNLGALGKSPEMPSSSRMSQSKSVRFAPEIEKENSTTDTQITIASGSADDLAAGHSKLIAEVLKKYPDLVKDKQNIKLKIVQRGTDAQSQSKDKSKVSYIVLKSTSSPDMGSVLLKKSNHASTANKTYWDGEKEKEKKISGAENTTGPWLCGPCGGGDESPMVFESYYVYRRHLVDIHGERIDARICEYCGQKASKRNLLLHHLYTKHGVAPPKNMTFPSCDRCDYVALSESLLSKHKLTHDATKEYSCEICNASFKSSSALQGHMAANLHRNKDTKVYECPYCRKPFVRNINLKGHIRALHKDIARIEEMDDPRLPHDESLTSRATTLNIINRKQRQFPSILGSRGIPVEILPGDGTENQQVSLVTADGHTIEILHGLDPNTMTVPMTLLPSSEADGMANVASSIAASLGLETQGVHGGTEFMTGVTSDGSQAVYIMDNSQPAVEVDMSAMGLASDGTMIYDGEDPTGHGQFIVQDIHGNQFRKMTGIDENGKQVIFFQLSEESAQMSMAPGILSDGMEMEAETSSVYVSSGLTVPVNVSSDSTQQTQVLLSTSGHDGTVYEMIPNQVEESHNQVVITPITEAGLTMTANQGVVDHDHEQQAYQDGMHQHQQIEQNVQELHIVLDHDQVDGNGEVVTDGSLINQEHSVEHSYVPGEEDNQIITGDTEDTHQHLQQMGAGDTGDSETGMTEGDEVEPEANAVLAVDIEESANQDQQLTQVVGTEAETQVQDNQQSDELHIDHEANTQLIETETEEVEMTERETQDHDQGDTAETAVDNDNVDTQENVMELEEVSGDDLTMVEEEVVHENENEQFQS